MENIKIQYKVYYIQGDKDKLIFASSNIDSAISEAGTYLEYYLSPKIISDLKDSFKLKNKESYTLSVNSKTVKIELIRS